MTNADFLITNHGSLMMVLPVTKPARAWVDENVDDGTLLWFGGRFAVKPRYIENLVDGMTADGLAVQAG